MKIIVRNLALALLVTGAVASNHTNATVSSKTEIVGRASALPIPVCPPDDPNGCGIAQLGK